jgi:hypothetical protein
MSLLINSIDTNLTGDLFQQHSIIIWSNLS